MEAATTQARQRATGSCHSERPRPRSRAQKRTAAELTSVIRAAFQAIVCGVEQRRTFGAEAQPLPCEGVPQEPREEVASSLAAEFARSSTVKRPRGEVNGRPSPCAP